MANERVWRVRRAWPVWPAIGLALAPLLFCRAPIARGATALPREKQRKEAAAGEKTAAAPAERASKKAVEPPGPFRIPEDLHESSRNAPFPDPARFVHIKLHGEVNLGMAALVERVIADLGARDILVLDINTFGGRVDAAVRIKDALLLARPHHGAWTVAYVHPRAISAGALVALATDIIAVAPGATIGAATPVQLSGGEAEAVGEKYVSYMRQEFRATAEARGRNGDIAEAMVDADREVDGLNDRGKLLTLDGKQAQRWKIASFEAVDLPSVVDQLGYGDGKRSYKVQEVRWSWAEEVAGWLSGSVLSGLLMTVGMLSIMIGLYTGGNPVPLVIGGVCLGLFFFGHHVVTLAGMEEYVLLTLGIVLLLVEIVVPGHIVPGVLGVLLVLSALVLALIDIETVPISVQWEEGLISRALATVSAALLATAVLSYAVFRVLPESKYGRRFLLPVAIEARATDAADEQHGGLLGQIGAAATDLRPSGKVKIGERRYDALSEHGFIPRGAAVKVLRTQGFSLVVGAVKENAS